MKVATDFQVRSLGSCRFELTIVDMAGEWAQTPRFVGDNARVLVEDELSSVLSTREVADLPSLELAGPRRQLFFKPGDISIGIVTCGGLCPSLNDVIRGLVMQAYYRYGIRQIYGFRYGYREFIPEHGHECYQPRPRPGE